MIDFLRTSISASKILSGAPDSILLTPPGIRVMHYIVVDLGVNFSIIFYFGPILIGQNFEVDIMLRTPCDLRLISCCIVPATLPGLLPPASLSGA